MGNRKDNKGRNLRTGESQRKDGQYMYRYIDVTGERQTVYSWKLTAFDKVPKGKKDDVSLREKIEEIELLLKSGISITARKLTLNELFDIYLQKRRYKGKPLAPKTKINYISEWNKNIRNTVIGHKKVAEICKVDIISFYGELLDVGLSYGTVTFFHKLLNAVFNYAMDSMEIIDKNPCRRALDNIEGKQKETIPLTKKQDKELMQYIKENNQEMYQLFLTMRETMVRIGECAALTKSDLDVENHMLTINKQLVYYQGEGELGGRLHISETKGRNERIIPLKDNVFEVLKKLADRATDEVRVDGVSGFLFTKNHGAYAPHNMRDDMCNMVAKYNKNAEDKIEEFTPKTLRHKGCTMYAREGLDISVLQYLLGHKTSYTTMRYYNHVTIERVFDSFLSHIENCA